MKPKEVCETVRRIAQPVVEDLGLILWDVEYLKEGADYYLHVYIDKEGGINITDCENVNRALNTLIDEADPIDESYIFDVSSAGIERQLKKQEHFDAFAGSDVLLRLYRAHDGSKEIIGKLVSRGQDETVIEAAGGPVSIENENIALARLYYKF